MGKNVPSTIPLNTAVLPLSILTTKVPVVPLSPTQIQAPLLSVLAIALALGVAIFTDVIDWNTLSEVQKGLITTFSGFFLRTLGDVYGYWFGSSMGSEGKTKDLTKLMRK